MMAPVTLTYYARICVWTLARAHARSGDPVAMASYHGGDDAFDRSITDFCERYADQNEQDYEQFVKAVKSGRLEAVGVSEQTVAIHPLEGEAPPPFRKHDLSMPLGERGHHG